MPDNKSEPTEMQKNLTQVEEEKIVEGLNTPLDDLSLIHISEPTRH